MATKYVVYGGTGHRRLRSFDTPREANDFASDFERKCWNGGAPVPRSWIEEEEAPDQDSPTIPT